MYEYVGQANALLPEVEGTKLDQETIWKRTALIEKIDELTNRVIRPEWVRVYVKEIHGLEIDGQPATIESFLSDAPSEMFVECVELIKGQAELSPVEVKN